MLEIFKALLKTGSGSLASLVFGFVTMKIMAVTIGPNGVGLFSQLQSIQQTFTTVGTLGGQTALVQGLCSREDEKRDTYLTTVLLFFCLGAVLTTIVLVGFASGLAPLMLGGQKDEQTIGLIRWVAVPVSLAVVLTFLSGVINGFRGLGLLALVQVINAVVSMLLAYPVASLVKADYPIAFVAMTSLSLISSVIFSFYVAYRAGWLKPLFPFKVQLNLEASKHFLGLAGATLITALLGSGTLLAVKSLIVQQQGLAGVGCFDAAWRCSQVYIMIVLSSFGTYYLPALSGTYDLEKRVLLIERVLRFFTLIMVPLVTSVILLKPLLIQVLYTSEFADSLKIIKWMLIGDYFKIASWVFAMPMQAYADVKAFFWTELLWNTIFINLSLLSLIFWGDLEGIGFSYLLAYIFYFTVVHHYSNKQKILLAKKTIWQWLIGLAIVLGVSWATWDSTTIQAKAIILFIPMSTVFSWLILTKYERKKLITNFKSFYRLKL